MQRDQVLRDHVHVQQHLLASVLKKQVFKTTIKEKKTNKLYYY